MNTGKTKQYLAASDQGIKSGKQCCSILCKEEVVNKPNFVHKLAERERFVSNAVVSGHLYKPVIHDLQKT